MGIRQRTSNVAFAALLGALCGAVHAGELRVSVTDMDGKPVTGAVVSLETGTPIPAAPGSKGSIDQHGREFVPHVIAVQMGTPVTFPNSDDIHHDVYSFSPAKTFELPLYKGTPSNPVSFDKPGVVVLGCNIHDWMLGYIDVVPTPWFGVTGADGKLVLQAPDGQYQMVLWQPDLDLPDHRQAEKLELGAQPLARDYRMPFKAPLVRKQHPVNTLEDKFKRFKDAKAPPLPD